MLPSRESIIKQLLHIRRLFRHRPKLSLLSDGKAHPEDSTTKRRHPSQLPQVCPDAAPKYLPVILFFFALLPRLYRISYPPEVVFDEVHFLRFVRGYYYGEYFFDIHPPLGKLILYMVTYLFCGDPKTKFDFNGQKFGHQSYVPLRVTSALFGATVSPLSYLICREMGFSLPASLVPAVIHAVEHLSLIESRLVLIDAQLISFMALTLLLALKMWGKPRGRRWPYVIGTAFVGALAISVKWTALVTPALIGIVSLLGKPFPSKRLLLVEMVVAALVAFTVYTTLFGVHFALLPNSGKGDVFMKEAFKKTLHGGKKYVKGYKGPGFVRNFLYLNYEMFIANRGIKTRHHWESKWWQWMINQRGLLYYNHFDAEDEAREKIYLIVNPFVTVITLMSLMGYFTMSLVWCIKKVPRKHGKFETSRRMQGVLSRGSFFFAGYVLNLLPYIEVARCTFLYHYLPPLFYAVLGTANLVDGLGWQKGQWLASMVICTGVIVTFFIWNGWIYATGMSGAAHKWRELYGEKWE